ncbi:MAG TPA: CHRD domain-containing protein [Gemmatimonadaceae bacterium]|nr:CHRD domain-containing protein [Gemmatimonadaceae bacterium]
MHFRILGIAASVALVAGWTGPSAPRPQAVKYVAQMTGAAETPANTTTGTGTAHFTLVGMRLRYAITVKGLTGAATMAHIHVGKVGVGGPPVYSFTIKHVASGGLASGFIDLAKEVSKGVSGDSLMALINGGDAYVNVHTAANKGGEIRGQIEKQ